MKTKDIAKQYGINQKEFESFLEKTSFNRTSGIMGINLADNEVGVAVKQYKEQKAKKEAEDAERKRQQQEREAEQRRKEQERLEAARRKEEEKKHAIATMLVSSGFSFDGYTIKRYSGYISGDDTIQIDRDDLNKNNGQYLTDCLAKIRIQALKELKEAAYDLGCNAIIGVDFDYITFEPETVGPTGTHYFCPYMVCVTANGNAVLIEKN